MPWQTPAARLAEAAHPGWHRGRTTTAPSRQGGLGSSCIPRSAL